MKSIFFAGLLSLFMVSHAAKVSTQHRPVIKTVGGVYVMTNDIKRNSIIAYSRLSNGTLVLRGSFPTQGKGAILDDMDGADPLFSAYSLLVTQDNRFIIAVNAGSRSVSVFAVLPNFSLRLTSVTEVPTFGPVSVAHFNGLVYVTSIESSKIRSESTSIFMSMGALAGFRLTRNGRLIPLRGSFRRLTNRPAAVQFSPDGRSLVVSSFPTGSDQLDSKAVEELVVYKVLGNGLLSPRPVSIATSTERDDPKGRNLPSAIGFDMENVNGVQYVVVSEARVFNPSGGITDLQTSSVSIWKLTSSSKLIPSQLDVLVGPSVMEGERAACWVEFSKKRDVFWVSNTVSGTLSSFSFTNGKAKLVEQVAAKVPDAIDFWRSVDGRFLYQLSNGRVDVFEVSMRGLGTGLKPIQTVTGIPTKNVQGIVAI